MTTLLTERAVEVPAGGRDTMVLRLNEEAYARLTSEKRMEVVPGATHLFEEPGALEAVARLATGWFLRHLDGALIRPRSGRGQRRGTLRRRPHVQRRRPRARHAALDARPGADAGYREVREDGGLRVC